MAPTRPVQAPKRVRNATDGPRQGGVKKRKKSLKEDGHLGRGRKKTWSLPWLKRLVVLRMCGLHFSEIFELLNVLSGGTTPNVERTAQYNMKRLLGDGWKGLCAPDKETSRRFLTLLAGSEQRRFEAKSAKRIPQAFQDDRSLDTMSSNTPVAPEQANPSITVDPSVFSFRPMDERCVTFEDVFGIIEAFTSFSWDIPSADTALSTYPKPPEQEPRFTIEHEVLPAAHDEPSSTPQFQLPETTLPTISPHQNNPDEWQSVLSDQSARISEILRRFSYTSLDRTLIKRVARLRYSFSSYATSNMASALEPSPNPPDPNGIYEPPLIRPFPTVFQTFRYSIRLQNRQLVHKCCSVEPNCIHKSIAKAIVNHGIVPGATETLQSLESALENLFMHHDCSPLSYAQDCAGCNALFFAAGLGAPLSVLSILLDPQLVHRVDNDNRTFLFHLDLAGIAPAGCICVSNGGTGVSHGSAFECLMVRLEAQGFNFAYTDNDDKNFLSWLCLSPYFRVEWLCSLMRDNTKWKRRIDILSRLPDSSELTFADRLSSQDRATLAGCIAGWDSCDTIRVAYSGVNKGLYQSRGLQHLHETCFTRTPVDDDYVLQTVQKLYTQGANLDIVYRPDGATLNTLALKHGCYKTYAFLTSLNNNVSSQDSASNALEEYAVMLDFNRSRSSKAPASLTARSMKSLARLLKRD
ncbi:hypothetical protein CC80DRAFT_535026 [Byssothecium circinans]|uniref:Ankyrin n=1 Tax=Byssothecium circinans TaxID=147558 RepID=A0A6A5TZD0_9PLEO|nr:hypothetical protein CC80DRAFT_535026 [Byssothecium circinans]